MALLHATGMSRGRRSVSVGNRQVSEVPESGRRDCRSVGHQTLTTALVTDPHRTRRRRLCAHNYMAQSVIGSTNLLSANPLTYALAMHDPPSSMRSDVVAKPSRPQCNKVDALADDIGAFSMLCYLLVKTIKQYKSFCQEVFRSKDSCWQIGTALPSRGAFLLELLDMIILLVFACLYQSYLWQFPVECIMHGKTQLEGMLSCSSRHLLEPLHLLLFPLLRFSHLFLSFGLLPSLLLFLFLHLIQAVSAQSL